MGEFSILHWLVVALVVVLLFGVKRLPELGTGLGEAIGNFRKAYRDGMAIDMTPGSKNQKQISENESTDKNSSSSGTA